MSQSALALAPTLTVVGGVPTTTSNEVADFFGRDHKSVLRAIENLLDDLPEDARRNFAPSEYTDPTGRKLPAYRLTRDGFTLLAMGFTGKKALAFKLAYIDAFNRMEAAMKPSVPTLPVDAERMKQAQTLAAEVAAAASRAVFDAVLSGNDDLQYERFLFGFGWDSETKSFSRPHAKALDYDEMVVSFQNLPARIAEPGAMIPSDDLLALMIAVSKRLAGRLKTAKGSSALPISQHPGRMAA